MTILQAHKYYWHRDGASNYMFELSELLEHQGHTVVPFAMQTEHNLETPYSKYFVSQADLSDPSQVGLGTKINSATRMFYSREAKRNIRALLDDTHIDVAHLHNIYHHISPSILPVLKKRGIPIVMTLHDYKLICPNYTMFHHGQVHEEDCRGWYGTCVKNKCMKDSAMQSRIVRWEMVFHHKFMRYYERLVDRFISPSQFLIDKCVEFGWPREKFIHIEHPVSNHRAAPLCGGDSRYVAFVGRLAPEKGVDVLLQAARLTPHIEYNILGDGPERERLEAYRREHRLVNVNFLGFQSGEPLRRLVRCAALTVVPSIWYENYPLVVLESKSSEKIVIGSRIGGISEMLPEQFLVEPNNPQELAQKIDFWYHKSFSERQKWGRAMKHDVETTNAPERHISRILRVYDDVLTT